MFIAKFAATVSALLGVCSGLYSSKKCRNDKLRCPKDQISCSTTDLNTCCTPDVGLYTYSVGWYPKTGPADSFTIHGLWPDYCNGTWPPNYGCDTSRHLSTVEDDIKAVNPELHKYMVNYWPSSNGDAEEFWLHEWNKHGTCVSTAESRCNRYNPVNGTEAIRYYEQTVEYFKIFDVYNALKKHNIVPTANNTNSGYQVKYKVSDIKAAIKEEIGAEVAISCKNNIFYEVLFYFNVKNGFEPVYIKPLINDTCTELVYINKY
ncbi:hypothetical protein BB561_000258 [Smittium simulii]|uniref:ribonuclease T2 n=1 Tax=Smittium simulii TaxID=133385 RepID=A0A2T9YZY5_9FUNG|nr:hypothetical protein BB561_000258 [Smittium simulii]